MALSDIINAQITATSVGVTQAGFGVPLILAVNADWAAPERIRFYTDITGVADDFAATDPEYLAANAIFSQSPRPERIAIGKLSSLPTQKRTITPTVQNATDYSIRVGSETFTYTSDADATAAEIVAGLIALINAGTDNLTATGTTTLVLTADDAGLWDDVEVLDPSLLSLEQDHADPGVATDLSAIKVIDDSWYAIVNLFNSKAMALAIAAWAESNNKLFVCATQDSPCVLDAEGSATDVMKSAKTSAYFRTAFLYHPSAGDFADAAWCGRVLPLDPGSETWAFKTLAGVSAVALTSTQRTNVLNKNGSVYETIAGVNVTEQAKTASGEWVDVVRFRDWIIARIGERCFASLAANAKIPYTDAGVAIIAGDVRSVLSDGVQVGGLADYSVIVGKVADADPADKAARTLKLVNWTATLAGAIHKATINGSVSA